MPTSLQKLESAIERAFLQFEMRSLRDRYRNQLESEVALRTFELEHHVEEIEAAVRRRLSQGAMEPVMLRENDLHVPAL